MLPNVPSRTSPGWSLYWGNAELHFQHFVRCFKSAFYPTLIEGVCFADNVNVLLWIQLNDIFPNVSVVKSGSPHVPRFACAILLLQSGLLVLPSWGDPFFTRQKSLLLINYQKEVLFTYCLSLTAYLDSRCRIHRCRHFLRVLDGRHSKHALWLT